MPIAGFPVAAGYPVSGAQSAAPTATSAQTPQPYVPPPLPAGAQVNPAGTSPVYGTSIPATIGTNAQGQPLPNPGLSQTAVSPNIPQTTPQTFPQPSQPGQVDPTTLYQTLSQLYDPGQLISYAQQGEAIQSGLTQEGTQTASQLLQNAVQNQIYGVQGQQAASTLANQLAQYGLNTQGENQSYATALRNLNSSLGASGMAASGQAGLQRSDLLSTHQRNLAGLGISETQARQDQGYTAQQLGLEQQRIGLQSELAKALYAGDTTSANQALQLLATGSTLTQAQNVIAGLPDLGLGLGPGMPPTATSGAQGSSATSSANTQFNQSLGSLDQIMNQVLGTSITPYTAPAATPLTNVGGF